MLIIILKSFLTIFTIIIFVSTAGAFFKYKYSENKLLISLSILLALVSTYATVVFIVAPDKEDGSIIKKYNNISSDDKMISELDSILGSELEIFVKLDNIYSSIKSNFTNKYNVSFTVDPLCNTGIVKCLKNSIIDERNALQDIYDVTLVEYEYKESIHRQLDYEIDPPKTPHPFIADGVMNDYKEKISQLNDNLYSIDSFNEEKFNLELAKKEILKIRRNLSIHISDYKSNRNNPELINNSLRKFLAKLCGRTKNICSDTNFYTLSSLNTLIKDVVSKVKSNLDSSKINLEKKEASRIINKNITFGYLEAQVIVDINKQIFEEITNITNIKS